MKLTNTGGDVAPSGHLLSPNEASSTGNGLYPIKLLAKEVPWEHPNNPGYCQGSPQVNSKAPIAEDNTYATH